MEPLNGKVTGMSGPEDISTRVQRVAQLAREAPDMAFTSLAYHVDVEFLREAYRRTRKDGAVGVDGQTADEYAANLEANLLSLLERFKSGTYHAPPVRRVHIPKGDGSKTRPIGIPTFEDKVLQRAVAMLLEAVYEQDFMPCSFGFRPGRSAHQALAVLWRGLMDMGGGWVIDVDIRSFFDTLDHGHLRSFLDQRVRDGVLRRAVGKWLNAGVLESGSITRSEEGTPQGGVISPLLANVYLHEVLDKWFESDVKPRLEGRAFLVRYADDFVMVFSSESDARRVMDVLPKRFGRYGLTLHPEKTRLVVFRRPRQQDRDRSDDGPGASSFDLLGFTHFWAKSRKGRWMVARKTAKSRFSRGLKRVVAWCRDHRHEAVREQHAALSLKLRGHYAYYGITGNARALACFARQVERAWRKWLDRRSSKARMTWVRFRVLLERLPLPPPRVVHSVYRNAASP
jgi:group II intron reverse transcriptase/maturase